MPPGAPILALSIGLASLVGFAAAYGGICAVRAMQDLLEGRGGTLFLGFLKCSAWVLAVILPLAWTVAPEVHLAFGYRPDWRVAVGGFLFGIGAALNGGCAFSTLTHLAMGDLGAGFALLGLGLGFALHGLWVGPLLPVPLPRPSPLAQPEPWSLALLAAVWVWATWEAMRLWRRAPGDRTGRVMAAIGLAGGVLYVLHGPWMYTAALAQGTTWAARVGPAPTALPPILFLAVLVGVVLGVRARKRFRPRRLTWTAAMRGLGGGVLMGAGAALVPGGNDALVLHALPGLLPHAALAYAAVVAGIGCTLLSSLALHRTRRRQPP
jgi:hypothetical protein